MERVQHVLLAASRLATIVCGWWLLTIVVMTCVEIVGRKFLGFSLQAVDELGAYTLAVTSAFGFTLTLLNRGHTRVDFLILRLPTGVQACLNVLAMQLLAGLALFAAWRGVAVLADSLELKSTATTPLQTPLWIPQSLWLAGICLFAAACLVLAAHATALLLTDHRRLNGLYGAMTLDEEIEHEVGNLGASIAADQSRHPGSVSNPARPRGNPGSLG